MILSTLAVKIFCEELLLRRKYPEYRAYAQRTARLIPYLFYRPVVVETLACDTSANATVPSYMG